MTTELKKIWNVTLYLRLSREDGDKEESNSITSQRELLRDFIARHPDMKEYTVRVDDGWSGSTFERPDFQRMIEDVKAGRTDCIIVKDLSRFGRNYLDAGEYIEKIFPFLGVRFIAVNDNYDSMAEKKASDDLIIPFKNLINEAYCRDISVKIRTQLEIKRKSGQYLGSFASFGYLKDPTDKNRLIVDEYAAAVVRDIFKWKLEGISPEDIADALNRPGVLSPMPYAQFLGYRKGADGLPEIVPEEAAIVIRIYREFIGGKTLSAIARRLTEDGIPTPGKKTVWQSSTVRSILTNEKYKGSALLQKKYTVDFLSKTMKVNEGEVPQYYVEESHPSIIQPSEWEAVQIELAQRKARGRRHDCHTPFSGKIICGDCGSVFGSKVWHSTSKYRQTIWQCNHKFDGEEKCSTPHLRESIIKDRFQQALGEYMAAPEERIEGLRYAKKTMTDNDFIDADIDQAERDLELLSGMIRNCITMNATAALTETEYRQQYEELTRQYESKKAEYDALLAEKESREALDIVFSGILFQLTELQELPAEFRESLWHTLVDHVTVYSDERIVFTFKDGTEIVTML